MPRILLLLLFWLSGPMLSAQLTLAFGDEAPRITPTEYLVNGLKKSDLKGKFIVLTLCKSWDQPCLSGLAIQDSLRTAYASNEVTFLTLFRGSTESARADINGKGFGIPIATDLYGKTQILYGDGETGLLGWPLTVLIDNQNIVRWQDNGDDLTTEALDRFVSGQQPILDFSDKYVPLSPDDFLFEPMTIEDVAQLYEADSVDSFVRVWDQDDFAEDFFGSFHFASYDVGTYGPAPLEDIFRTLFPKKRIIVPGELMEKEYRVAFVQRFTDRKTADRVASQILDEIGLRASVSSLPTKYYELEIINQEVLSLPRITPRAGKPPKGQKDLGGYNAKDLTNFEVREYGLANLAKLLNKYSPDRWRYTGNNRKKYNFILDVSSTKALLKSLRKHGIGATGKAGTVEEITLERKR